MIVPINKTIIFVAIILLLAGCFAGAYTDEPLLLFVPLALLVIVFLIHYPRALFYTLIASIPWSAEFHFSESLGTDLPDEPLMLLTAFAALILWMNRNKFGGPRPFHPLLFLLFSSVCWWIITFAN